MCIYIYIYTYIYIYIYTHQHEQVILMYKYDLFMLRYGRDHHNIVKQLSSNKKYKKK